MENYQRAYQNLNESEKNIYNIQYNMDNFGKLTCKVPKKLDRLTLSYCKGFESLYSDSDMFMIGNLEISRTCEALLPNSIQDCYIQNLHVDGSILCQQVFKNCRIDRVDLRTINIESKLLLFDNCKIQHLILPKWYDSWEFLDVMDYPIDIVEITNTNCTTAIWEISTKNKLQFKKIVELLLPSDFEEQQEEELRRLLPNLPIARRLPEALE